MSGSINTSSAVVKKITCMAKVTFNPILRIWLDAAKTIPDPLIGSRFDMDVRDREGNLVLDFSTETEPGGFTIQNTNELAFLKSAEVMDIEPGIYYYNLQRTVDNIVVPYAKGDFVVEKNTNTVIVDA